MDTEKSSKIAEFPNISKKEMNSADIVLHMSVDKCAQHYCGSGSLSFASQVSLSFFHLIGCLFRNPEKLQHLAWFTIRRHYTHNPINMNMLKRRPLGPHFMLKSEEEEALEEGVSKLSI
jgi:hypothetical protein